VFLTLANRLRADGIDCVIDQYVVVPGGGMDALDGKGLTARTGK
jgi:hypothetical protein